MPFDKLPYAALVELFQRLEPADRLRCTEVCRSWYEAISTRRILTEDIKLKVHSRNAGALLKTLEDSPRRYRQLVALLGAGNGNDGVLRFLSEVTQQQWDITYLELVGGVTPVQRVILSNSFSALTELELVFLASRPQSRRMGSPMFLVSFEHLERFRLVQYHGKNSVTDTILRLMVPNLKQAEFVVKDSTNINYDEYLPLVELRQCSELKHLEVDMEGNTWEYFFTSERPLLERLVIRQSMDGLRYRNWDMMFTNAPNLRWLEIVGRRFGLCEIFIGELNTHVLERLHLKNVCLRGRETLLCEKLTELTCSNVYRRYGTFTLIAPDLTRLSMRDCCYSGFILRVGSQLQSLTMGCLGNDCASDVELFQSLEHLRELTLYINEHAVKIIHHLGTLPSLRSLKVMFRSLRKKTSCNNLVETICSNCPAIRELTIENESEKTVRISHSSYEQLGRLRLELLELYRLDGPS